MLLAACRSPRVEPAAAAPQPEPATLVAPVVDLSGGWATGSANEPPPGPVVLHPSCAHNPAVWIIQQQGNSLKSWAMPESFNQGIKRAGPGSERVAAVSGTISGADVLIGDADVRFVLHYDAESGHLRGTRNGAPFWAARQQIVKTECPGIP